MAPSVSRLLRAPLLLSSLLCRASATFYCETSIDPLALSGRIEGHFSADGLAEASRTGLPVECLFSIDPAEKISSIRFNSSFATFGSSDKLEFYGDLNRNGPYNSISQGAYSRFRRLPSPMFTLSDEVHIVLRGSSAETHFELYYECIVDENEGLKLSALWLSLWLTMLFLMVFVCCALGFWMMRHRRRRLEDLRDAHSIMIHGELVRMRSQANRRAALEEVTAQEVGDVAALEAIPVRTASECELTEVNGGAAEETAECSLCLEAFKPTDEVRLLPCEHYFHKTCIDKWFHAKQFQNRSCPLCKRNPISNAASVAPMECAECPPAEAAGAVASAAADTPPPADTEGQAAAGESVQVEMTTAAVNTHTAVNTPDAAPDAAADSASDSSRV